MTRASERDGASLRFAWYGRLSTDELQQPQLAFPSQKAACEKRIDDLGRIVCEFIDVQSGRRDDRAGIEAMLDEASLPDRRFDAVVTYKAERFARRMALALAYEEELHRVGVPVYVSDEAGEPGRPTSVLTRRIKQAVGEWYVLELVEESRRGMEENTRQGFNTGGVAPYGYRKRYLPHPSKTMAERGHRKILLEPDPETAPVVARIFNEFVHGDHGIRGIVAMLNEEGIPSARGGRWGEGAISGILDNPKYTGYQVWNRRGRKTRRNAHNDEADWIWSEEPAHEAIVLLDLWRAAQALRRRKDTDWRRRPRSGRAARPLRGLVHCGSCARRMAAVHRKRTTMPVRWYWECPICKQRMQDDRLQAEVVVALERELLRPERLTALERHQEASQRKTRKEALKARTSLQGRLQSTRAEQRASSGTRPRGSIRSSSRRSSRNSSRKSETFASGSPSSTRRTSPRRPSPASGASGSTPTTSGGSSPPGTFRTSGRSSPEPSARSPGSVTRKVSSSNSSSRSPNKRAAVWTMCVPGVGFEPTWSRGTGGV